MSKKKLNVDAVLNELSGKSAYFKRDQSPIGNEEIKDKKPDRPVARSLERPTGRTPERPTGISDDDPIDKQNRRGRRRERYSFEAYSDQVDRLREISNKSALKGNKIHISVMIRDAVDEFLKDKK